MMNSLNRKPRIYRFNEAAAAKKRGVDAFLLHIFQDKAYNDIKALVQLKIWELEGEDTPKMADHARQLKAGKGSGAISKLIKKTCAGKAEISSSTRLQKAMAAAADTAAVIDEFAECWLKNGGNEGELITQVMAKEMGGQDLRIDWPARILPELENYTAYNMQTIVPAIEARIGQRLPTLMPRNRTPNYARGLLKFKKRG
jgi:hypothetical protein